MNDTVDDFQAIDRRAKSIRIKDLNGNIFAPARSRLCLDCGEFHPEEDFCNQCGKCLWTYADHVNSSKENNHLCKCECGQINVW